MGLAVFMTVPFARAFVIGGGWPNGTIEMKLQLDAGAISPAIPMLGLQDGSDSWDQAVEPTFDEWNAHMDRTQFTWTRESVLSAASGDGINQVFFGNDIFGNPFGSGVLAVTSIRSVGVNRVRFTECDVTFNRSVTWNSYRGNLQNAIDIRRVALHEFGHVVGLDHPDQATPPQAVSAVMNSIISNTATLRDDDISGVEEIYDSSVKLPVITSDLAGFNAVEGGSGALTIALDGVTAPTETDLVKYAWFFQPTGGQLEALFTVHDGSIPLGAAQISDSGSYYLTIESPLGEVTSSHVNVSVSSKTKTPVTRLANLSTRGVVGTGDRALIVGFVIGGSDARQVLIRGVGPKLSTAPFNLSGVISDPVLTLTKDSTTVASNDDWESDDAANLKAAFAQVGAFAFDPGSKDAAVIATLQPGAYTALITSGTGTEGIGLVEAYDLDATSPEENRLVNLSTRGFVGTGDQVMIAGFVVSGPGPRTYLLRAVGDTLGPLGISNYMDDTTLELYDSTSTLLRKTDDWDSPDFLQATLSSVFSEVGAIALTDRQESAMLLTLEPGAYSLKLAGFDNSTGIALAEIYEVPVQ